MRLARGGGCAGIAGMPYDPNLPIANSPASSSQMRAQFAGLKALIDAVPAGPPGPAGGVGPQGPPFASAVVDGVATLPPGDDATASAFFDGANVHLSFGIPRGADAAPVTSYIVDGVNTLVESTVHFSFGIPRGNDGAPGPQGGPFTNFVVDTVNTLQPWENATLQVSFDGSAVHFAFGIPRGRPFASWLVLRGLPGAM